MIFIVLGKNSYLKSSPTYIFMNILTVTLRGVDIQSTTSNKVYDSKHFGEVTLSWQAHTYLWSIVRAFPWAAFHREMAEEESMMTEYM